MKPHIEKTSFGSITIDGETFDHDIIIRLSGKVKKRKKKLSKKVFGTSHTISVEEAEYMYDEGAEILIFGTGQNGMASMSPEAEAFFMDKGCRVEALPTPKAVNAYNKAAGKVIGLFHITC